METGGVQDRSYHIEALAAFCRRHPVERKILFAPSRQIGFNVLTHLTRSGTPWTNLEALSVIDFAREETETALLVKGWRPASVDLIHLIVEKILRRIKDEDPTGYFAPVAVSPSLVRSVWSTLAGIRMAGLTPNAVSARIDDSIKGRALDSLTHLFAEELEKRRVFDSARLLDHASRMGPCPYPVLILGETNLTGIEIRFLRSRFDDRLEILRVPDSTVRVPQTIAQEVFGFGREAAAGDDPPLSEAFDPFEGVEQVDLTVYGAKGPEYEVKDAIKWALNAGVSIDSVEIAYSRGATYVPMILDAAERLGIDVSFGEGIPATLTRPGRALVGLLRWILDDFPASDLAGLLEAGHVQFQRVEGESPAPMSRFASFLREAPIGEKRRRYERGLSALVDEARRDLDGLDPESSRYKRLERRHRDLLRLRRSIRDLFAGIPDTETSNLGALASLARRFLEHNAIAKGDLEIAALDSLMGRIDNLPADEVVSLKYGLQSLIDMVQRQTVQVSTARPGSLHVVDISRAGYSGRPNLFVVGLDVDSFPGRISEDPILLDLERERISQNLGKRSEESGARVWHLLRSIHMNATRVFLGTTTFDAEREDTAVYPSPLIQSAAHKLGVPFDDLPQLDVGTVTFDDVDLLLPQRDRHDFRQVLETEFPTLRMGEQAVQERQSVRLTRYDGWLGEGDEAFSIRPDGPVLSSTRLENLADCGYRYFLTYVLGIREPEYYKMDPARWLSPKDFGIFLHDLYHEFLDDLKAKGERASIEAHRSELLQRIDEKLEAYRQRFPVDNLAAHNFQVQRLRNSAATFLLTESQSVTKPILFELIFGYPDAADKRLLQPAKIELDDGMAFLFAGRIDRIDESPAGLVVWDYKTGSSWKFQQGSILRGGLNLQWTLYGLAAKEISERLGMDARVASSGYYFASDRENGLQLADSPLSSEKLSDVIGPLLHLVQEGAFAKINKDDGACRFCDFKTICEKESIKKRDIEITLDENQDLPFVEHLRRWMEVK